MLGYLNPNRRAIRCQVQILQWLEGELRIKELARVTCKHGVKFAEVWGRNMARRKKGQVVCMFPDEK